VTAELDAIVDAWASDDPGRGSELFDVALAQSGSAFADLLNPVAMRIAERFLDGALTYDEADGAANEVWGRIQTEWDSVPAMEVPQAAFAIYEAFDAGEFDHRGDPDGSDPVQLYTIRHLRALELFD